MVNEIHGGGEKGFDAVLAGLIAYGQSDMGFPRNWRSHEDDVLFEAIRVVNI